MSRGTQQRGFRIPDELWQAALDKTAAEGRTVTEVVLSALRRYVSK